MKNLNDTLDASFCPIPNNSETAWLPAKNVLLQLSEELYLRLHSVERENARHALLVGKMETPDRGLFPKQPLA